MMRKNPVRSGVITSDRTRKPQNPTCLLRPSRPTITARIT